MGLPSVSTNQHYNRYTPQTNQPAKQSFDMGSFARAARFLLLIQIVLFVLSAVIMSGSVRVGASGING
jgi:hypothetical protein